MVPAKIMIIGLDCAEPSLVFDRWRDELPTLGDLVDRGAYGPLTSVIPPITVPAWSCMMSSRTPGDLGVYGSGIAPTIRMTVCSSRTALLFASPASGIS